eukprot:m.22004 g.22004  ORF g.22004 m.22004 type:complete len:212 (-) comp8345_c0_seq1:2198-2833(-)
MQATSTTKKKVHQPKPVTVQHHVDNNHAAFCRGWETIVFWVPLRAAHVSHFPEEVEAAADVMSERGSGGLFGRRVHGVADVLGVVEMVGTPDLDGCDCDHDRFQDLSTWGYYGVDADDHAAAVNSLLVDPSKVVVVVQDVPAVVLVRVFQADNHEQVSQSVWVDLLQHLLKAAGEVSSWFGYHVCGVPVRVASVHAAAEEAAEEAQHYQHC